MSQAAPGWYPDPERPGTQRYWDGDAWTDHRAPAQSGPPRSPSRSPAPASPAAMADPEARQWAMFAHLSALVALVIGFTFVGPLIIYLLKRDSHPYIREQAAEALNFNLSVAIYAIVLGTLTVLLIIFIVGILLIPVLIAGAIAWIVYAILGAVRASQGRDFRYPLTIRFVS